MKKIVLVLLLISVVTVSFKTGIHDDESKAINQDSEKRLKKQVAQVKKVVTGNSNYNSEITFFIDMRIASGKNRFFIYDLKNNNTLDKGLVAHGSGSETGTKGHLNFSNVNNSFATSLGNYSIGYPYEGRFGKAYKLYGLDNTNSNAFDRSIVLHHYYDVPYEEQETDICNSLGCPMVNKKFFSRIEKIIDNSKTKIILNIYY